MSEINTPHLNLYDLDVPKKSMEKILNRIKKIALNQKSFEVNLSSINYFHFGLFFIELQNNRQLCDLHKKIVKEISLLKEDCICNDYLQPERKYNSKQKGMLKNYGNPHVLTQFNPYITLGLVKEKNIDAIKKEIEPLLTLRKFRVDSIHIVIEEDTKKEVIANFNLQNDLPKVIKTFKFFNKHGNDKYT